MPHMPIQMVKNAFIESLSFDEETPCTTDGSNIYNKSIKPKLAKRSLCGAKTIITDQDQTPQNAVSDQALFCILTGCSIKN